MNRKLVKQWVPRMLVVATLTATGGVIAAEREGTVMNEPDMPTYMQLAQMDSGGYGMGMMGAGPGAGMGMDMMGMGGSGMGMMGGMGMGPGGGMGPVWKLDLTDEQRGKIEKIHDDVRRKNWDTYGKIMDEQARLRDLYSGEIVDAKKVGATYGSIAKLQQQVIEANVEAHNRVQAVLTKEQKEQLRQWSRGGMGGRGMMGPGGRGGCGPGNRPGGGMGMGPGMMNH